MGNDKNGDSQSATYGIFLLFSFTFVRFHLAILDLVPLLSYTAFARLIRNTMYLYRWNIENCTELNEITAVNEKQ